MGKPEDALNYHQIALGIRTKRLGEEHPSVALSYNSIGKAYALMGDSSQALHYHKMAL